MSGYCDFTIIYIIHALFKMKNILTDLLLLLVISGYGQQSKTSLLEALLLKTEKETVAFLQQASGRTKHQVQWDGAYRSFSLEGPSFHIEYKLDGDTCVMAAIQFQSKPSMYVSFVGEVRAQTKPLGENRLKEAGAKKLIYVLNSREKIVSVIRYAYAQQKIQGR